MRKLCMLFGLILLQATLSAQSSERERNLLATALAAFHAGQYQQSILYFDSLITIQPNSSVAYSMRGRALFFTDQKKKAIQSLTKAIETAPLDGDNYFFRCLVYSRMNKKQEALEDIKRALAVDAERPSYVEVAAGLQHTMGHYQAAIELYEQLTASYPDNPELLYYLGVNKNIIGERKAAKIALLQAEQLALSGDDPESQLLLASIYGELNHAQRALRILNKIIAQDDQAIYPLSLRGAEYLKAQQYELARQDFSKIMELDPTNLPALNSYSYCLIKLGKSEEAVRYLNRIIEQSPHYCNAYGNRGNAYMQLGDYEAALSDFNQGIALKPDHPGIYKLRGELFFKLNQPEKGCQDIKKAMDQHYGNLYHETADIQQLYQANCE